VPQRFDDIERAKAMTTDQVIKKLEPWLAKHQRPAWKPVVENGDGPPTVSKFSGMPWIGADDPWPNCGHCSQPLQLFLQLNLDDLPSELGQPFGTGLLQLFYCCRGECQGVGGWEPFGDDLSRIRVVHPNETGLKSGAPDRDNYFPAKRITGWTRFIDLPKPSEHEELGLKYTHSFKDGTVKLECAELGLVFEGIGDDYLAETIANSELGDKLAGWPAWIQNVEYPSCPRCGQRMLHVFQVDSDHGIPFMFGDAGCGYITQCRDHKDVVAFGWSCH
jgi:uncharacterized protein YwqG